MSTPRLADRTFLRWHVASHTATCRKLELPRDGRRSSSELYHPIPIGRDRQVYTEDEDVEEGLSALLEELAEKKTPRVALFGHACSGKSVAGWYAFCHCASAASGAGLGRFVPCWLEYRRDFFAASDKGLIAEQIRNAAWLKAPLESHAAFTPERVARWLSHPPLLLFVDLDTFPGAGEVQKELDALREYLERYRDHGCVLLANASLQDQVNRLPGSFPSYFLRPTDCDWGKKLAAKVYPSLSDSPLPDAKDQHGLWTTPHFARQVLDRLPADGTHPPARWLYELVEGELESRARKTSGNLVDWRWMLARVALFFVLCGESRIDAESLRQLLRDARRFFKVRAPGLAAALKGWLQKTPCMGEDYSALLVSDPLSLPLLVRSEHGSGKQLSFLHDAFRDFCAGWYGLADAGECDLERGRHFAPVWHTSWERWSRPLQMLGGVLSRPKAGMPEGDRQENFEWQLQKLIVRLATRDRAVEGNGPPLLLDLCVGAASWSRLASGLLDSHRRSAWKSLACPRFLVAEMESLARAHAGFLGEEQSRENLFALLADELVQENLRRGRHCFQQLTPTSPGRGACLTHDGAVTALTVVRAGLLVTGSEDGSLRWWNLRDGRQAVWPAAHQGAVRCLETLGSQYVISAGADGCVKRWSIKETDSPANGTAAGSENGKPPDVLLAEHAGAVTALLVRPAGPIVSGGEDGTLLVRDAEGKAETVVEDLHEGPIQDLFSCGPHRFLSVGRDGQLVLWEQTMDGERTEWKSACSWEHCRPIRIARQLGDSRVAVADDTGEVVVLYVAAKSIAVEKRERLHFGRIHALVALDGGTALASAGEDGMLFYWRWQKDHPRALAAHLDCRIAVLACDAAGDWLAAGGSDGTVRLCSRGTGRTSFASAAITERTVHCGAITLLTPLEGDPGGRMISGSVDGRLLIWDRSHGDAVEETHKAAITCVRFLSDTCAVSAAADGSVWRWEWTASAASPPQRLAFAPAAVREVIPWSERGRSGFWTGDVGGAVLAWQGSSHEGKAVVVHPEAVTALCRGPDSCPGLLGSGSADGMVLATAPDSFQAAWNLHDGRVHDLLFWDQDTLLSAGADGLLAWRWKDLHQPPRRLTRSGLGVRRLCRIDDNRFLTGHEDGAVFFWRREEGDTPEQPPWERQQVFYGHTEAVRWIRVHPCDSESFATVGEDGRLLWWQLGQKEPRRPAGEPEVVHPGGATALFLCGEDVLVSAGLDRTVKAWDWEGRLLAVFVHDWPVRAVDACGDCLLLGSPDGSVIRLRLRRPSRPPAKADQ